MIPVGMLEDPRLCQAVMLDSPSMYPVSTLLHVLVRCAQIINVDHVLCLGVKNVGCLFVCLSAMLRITGGKFYK